jgi:formylglycine-generating enzyme required for sulfatase activity
MMPDDYAWYNLNSGLNPHPHGKKVPNISGIYDMHGNIREWCWDYYDANYYFVSPTNDPSGPLTGKFRVTRGGSYSDGKTYIRASARFAPPDTTISDCGLRLFRTIKN